MATEEETKQADDWIQYTIMIVIFLIAIIYFVMKLRQIKGDQFKPWNWSFSFWSGFYLWQGTQYVINPNFFMKGILSLVIISITATAILTTICWFRDRLLDYPQMSKDDKGTKGWERWKVLFSKLILPCFFFAFFFFFLMLQMKPGSDSWMIMITLLCVLSSLGIAFQVGNFVGWAIGLIIAISLLLFLMPSV